MAKILAISSQVVFGPVGLSAIVPALQAEGHEVLALPTTFLSNHPGWGKPEGKALAANDMINMVTALDKLGALKFIDAIITGYFANPEQVKIAAQLIEDMRCPLVLVDPVLGDHGKLYVPLPVAETIRQVLLPQAHIATPNAFELSWLTGIAVVDRETSIKAARKLNVKQVLATSVPMGTAALGTLLITADAVVEITTPLQKLVPHGTGDYLSGLFLARQFTKAKATALQDAMTILQKAIALSNHTGNLAVAAALHSP
jgi:pyridoxine kinase